MWIYDVESLNFLLVNQAAVKGYGYSVTEFESMTIFDLDLSDQVDRFIESFHTLEVGFVNGGIWTHTNKGGEQKLVEVTVTACESNGRPARMVMALDVTQSAEALRELRESRKRFELVSHATSDAIWDWNLADDSITWVVSPGGILATFEAEFPPSFESWKSHIHASQHDEIANSLGRAIDSDATKWEAEYRWRTMDGGYLDVFDRGTIVRDANGLATHFVGAISNITAQRRAERQLDRFFSFSSDIMLILNQDGQIVKANGAFLRVTGYAPNDVTGNLFIQFVDSTDLPRSVIEWSNIRDGNPTPNFTNRFRTSFGAVVWLEWQCDLDPDTGFCLCVVRDVTLRKQEEARLRLMEMATDNTSDIVIVTDADTIDEPGPRILFVNPAFTKVTGYSHDEVMGENPRLLQGPGTSRDALDRIRQHLASWQPVRQEVLNYTKSGEEIWLELSIQPVADMLGYISHWISVERDITERKRTELELAEARALLEQMLASINDAFLSFDDELKLRYINPSGVVLLGLEGGELFGRAIWELFPSIDRSSDRTMIQTAYESRVAVSFEHFSPESGKWMEVRIYPFEGGLSIYATPIDARKLAEEARAAALSELRRTLSSLNAILEQSIDLIATVNAHGMFLRVSESSLPILGVHPRELVGAPLKTIIHPDDHEIMERHLYDIRTGLDVGIFECRVVTQRGNSLELQWSAKARTDSDVIVIVGRDITDANRTRRGLERALIESKELTVRAEAGQRAQQQFLQNMSHELRTPLNGILGVSQLMQFTELSETQQHYVRTIFTSGEALLDILNDVLDTSMIEAGKFDVREDIFMPGDSLRSTIDLFRSAAEQKRISLAIHTDSRCEKSYFGDSGRIRQVLSNLIGNALKFTSEGSVKVSALVTSRGRLRFEVQDTGIGIAPENLSRVFDQFYQVDMSMTRKYGGVGLGLSIVRAIVQAMAGEVGVDSEVGIGSTFWFEVPVQSTVSEPVMSHRPSKKTFHGRILVVEDQPLNVEILVLWLRHHGIETDIAEDGFIALDKLKHNEFDLVLLDLNMPGLDGYEVLRRIRAESNRYIPVIAVTASAGLEDRKRCLAAGFDSFVAKPVLFGELEHALSAFLA